MRTDIRKKSRQKETSSHQYSGNKKVTAPQHPSEMTFRKDPQSQSQQLKYKYPASDSTTYIRMPAGIAYKFERRTVRGKNNSTSSSTRSMLLELAGEIATMGKIT
jgi:hypothetical protein